MAGPPAPACVFAAALALLALASAGCRPLWLTPTGSPAPAVISVGELAGRLKMRRARHSATRATLRDRANTVVIFADPAGQAYVNGRPVGTLGGITAEAGTLMVPAALEAAIKQALVDPSLVRKSSPSTRARSARGTVVLDAGHGGADPGAIGVLGRHEKNVNLVVALAVEKLLKAAAVRVAMTRRTDRSVSLDARVAVAGKIKPDLFVSIHADSSPIKVPSGYTVLVPQRTSPASQAAAAAVDRRLAKAIGPGRGVRTDGRNVRVLRQTRCPAVLVEMGFLSNYGDAALLADRRHRSRLADAIARGIVDYLKAARAGHRAGKR